MAIKAVIFDCFGVLVASAEVNLFNAYPQYSSQLTDLDKKANLGQFDKEEFLQRVSKLTGAPVNELVSHKYCNVDDRDRNESAIELAVRVKATGKYKMGFLSNVGRGWLDKFLVENSIEGLFDTVVLSCDVRMIKPDPRIFQLIADQMGLKPNECVMIDDRPENIAGAKSIGMHGIVFTGVAQTRAELDKILEL